MLKEADQITKDEETQTVDRALGILFTFAPHVAHDLDGLLARVFHEDVKSPLSTRSTVGFVRRLSEIAEEHIRRFDEMAILIKVRLRLHLDSGRYTEEQVSVITDPALKQMLGITG